MINVFCILKDCMQKKKGRKVFKDRYVTTSIVSVDLVDQIIYDVLVNKTEYTKILSDDVAKEILGNKITHDYVLIVEDSTGYYGYKVKLREFEESTRKELSRYSNNRSIEVSSCSDMKSVYNYLKTALLDEAEVKDLTISY